jgi:hypothetical protein
VSGIQKRGKGGKPKATPEDHLRAFAYSVFAIWAVVFVVWPPMSFASALDEITRILWMAITFSAAVIAVIGACKRIDFKLELPGLFFMLVGPVFYFISQLFYIFAPTVASGPPDQRISGAVYALLPTVLLLPRIIGLLREARRLKHVREQALRDAEEFIKDNDGIPTPASINRGRHKESK